MNELFDAYRARASALEQRGGALARGVAWIDGAFVPVAEAKIPLLDQGFLHSDLTYDVPAVWDGRFFRLDDHLDRLAASCEKMRLHNPMGREEIRDTLVDMVARTGIRDAFVELIVTRGLKFVREYKTAENSLYL